MKKYKFTLILFAIIFLVSSTNIFAITPKKESYIELTGIITSITHDKIPYSDYESLVIGIECDDDSYTALYTMNKSKNFTLSLGDKISITGTKTSPSSSLINISSLSKELTDDYKTGLEFFSFKEVSKPSEDLLKWVSENKSTSGVYYKTIKEKEYVLITLGATSRDYTLSIDSFGKLKDSKNKFFIEYTKKLKSVKENFLDDYYPYILIEAENIQSETDDKLITESLTLKKIKFLYDLENDANKKIDIIESVFKYLSDIAE